MYYIFLLSISGEKDHFSVEFKGIHCIQEKTLSNLSGMDPRYRKGLKKVGLASFISICTIKQIRKGRKIE